MSNLIKNLYFVSKGERSGQFLILIDFDQTLQSYSVLGLPESEILQITQKDINHGIETKILEFVEKVPYKIFQDCQKEFNYRQKVSTDN